MKPPVGIVSASGALLEDEKGNHYIDAVSSWWVNIHGHAHPYIAEKIYEQALKLEHVIFTGFTHEPAVRLAERLLQMLPGNFSRIFYSDNGSTAVEVALKMALQFWRNQSKFQGQRLTRTKIVAFKNAYHGDTFGAMSVSERGVFTKPFHDYLFDVVFIDTPTKGNISTLKEYFTSNAGEIACFIYEPLLQAAGGMLIHEAAWLDELLKAAHSSQIICIADEVLTGFGRTGKWFASDFLRQQAEIICLSKGITGGTMALGVTACNSKIFEAFLSDDREGSFFHGHSFTANPLACAAANASLDLLEKESCRKQLENLVESNRAFMKKLRHQNFSGSIENLRMCGTVLAFDIKSQNSGYLSGIAKQITEFSFQKGIYLRPLGNTVYIMPPYCITEVQLGSLYNHLMEICTMFSGGAK